MWKTQRLHLKHETEHEWADCKRDCWKPLICICNFNCKPFFQRVMAVKWLGANLEAVHFTVDNAVFSPVSFAFSWFFKLNCHTDPYWLFQLGHLFGKEKIEREWYNCFEVKVKYCSPTHQYQLQSTISHLLVVVLICKKEQQKNAKWRQ